MLVNLTYALYGIVYSGHLDRPVRQRQSQEIQPVKPVEPPRDRGRKLDTEA